MMDAFPSFRLSSIVQIRLAATLVLMIQSMSLAVLVDNDGDGLDLINSPKLELKSEWLENVAWRSIGPANMAGRITDIDVFSRDRSLWWVATASGGLLKTTNRGVTVEYQFDREGTVSIRAIANDPKDRNVVWVETGEINPRNSVS